MLRLRAGCYGWTTPERSVFHQQKAARDLVRRFTTKDCRLHSLGWAEDSRQMRQRVASLRHYATVSGCCPRVAEPELRDINLHRNDIHSHLHWTALLARRDSVYYTENLMN